MKKLITLLLVAGTLVGASAQAYTEDEVLELNHSCKKLAQHILKSRAQERLVKAQIKIADSKDEKKSLSAKLDKVQADIGSAKEEFHLACQTRSN